MQIGCSLIHAYDLERAKDIGFDYVEFMGKYLVSLPEKEYLHLQRNLERNQFRVLGINGYCPETVKMTGPEFSAHDIRAYAVSCAERAFGLGARYVGIGSPASRHLPPGYPVRTALLQMKEFLQITTEVFSRYEMVVCLEPLAPCYCNFINSLPEAAAVVEELQLDSLRMVIDFYNMEYVGEADCDLQKYMKWIAHAHISDDDGAPGLRSYLKPEKADIHKRRLMELSEAGYMGALSLEVDCRIDTDRAKESLDIMRKVRKERG